MIPSNAMETAEQAVIDAMIKHGPDGHIDGFHEITLAALEAAAPIILAHEAERARLERIESPWGNR